MYFLHLTGCRVHGQDGLLPWQGDARDHTCSLKNHFCLSELVQSRKSGAKPWPSSFCAALTHFPVCLWTKVPSYKWQQTCHVQDDLVTPLKSLGSCKAGFEDPREWFWAFQECVSHAKQRHLLATQEDGSALLACSVKSQPRSFIYLPCASSLPNSIPDGFLLLSILRESGDPSILLTCVQPDGWSGRLFFLIYFIY